jgi:hypothetical protein
MRGAARRARLAAALLAAVLLATSPAPAQPARRDALLAPGERIRVGVGDRVVLHAVQPPVRLAEDARRLGVPTDWLQIWLPRGWEESWIDPADLARLVREGTTPVLVHWFFGDAISRERVLAEGEAWRHSLRRMARRVAGAGPVLVVLEPEFNNAPPSGETPVVAWPGFGDALAEAARLVRAEAPQARVGACAGDFSPDRDLDLVLGRAAGALDFLAFQEMRARTRGEGEAYLDVGAAALDYARYLARFGRPLLLAYVAVSSFGGWEQQQARALAGLARRRAELRETGVFGAIYFQLRDDPAHQGYFGAAERAFGLATAAGEAKPALAAFGELAAP